MQEADRGPDISQSLDDLLDEIESISRDALSLKGETAGPSASVSGETGEGTAGKEDELRKRIYEGHASSPVVRDESFRSTAPSPLALWDTRPEVGSDITGTEAERLASHGGISAKSVKLTENEPLEPWWIDELKEFYGGERENEYCFGSKDHSQGDVSDEDVGKGSIDANVIVAPNLKGNTTDQLDSTCDNVSQTSTVADENDPYSIDSEGEMIESRHNETFELENKWKERLWVVARSGWSGRPKPLQEQANQIREDEEEEDRWSDSDEEFDGALYPNDAATALGASIDTSSLAASVYRNGDAEERRNVEEFRSLLADCLSVYSEVFHAPLLKRAGDESLDLSVNPYVPRAVVERLFLYVVRERMLAKASSDGVKNGLRPCDPNRPEFSSSLLSDFRRFSVRDNTNSDPPQSEETIKKCRRKAKRVVRALLSNDMNAFRRYAVGSVIPMVSNEPSMDHAVRADFSRSPDDKGYFFFDEMSDMTSGDDAYSRATIRQRKRKRVEMRGEDRIDIEKILYGRMKDTDQVPERGEESDYNTTNAPRTKGSATSEREEIRLRSSLVKDILSGGLDSILSSFETSRDKVPWTEVFARDILCDEILGFPTDNDDIFSEDGPQSDSLLFSVAPERLDVSLSEAYAVRYLPLFLARAALAANLDQMKCGTTLLLRKTLLSQKILHARSNILGPHFTTMLQLADWKIYDSLFKRIDDVEEGSTQVEEIVGESKVQRALSQALLASMEGVLYNADNAKIISITGINTSRAGNRGKKLGAARSTRSTHNSQVTSYCLEVGKALHHLGVRLGRAGEKADALTDLDSRKKSIGGNQEKQQCKTSSRCDIDQEISNYHLALKAYRNALTMLKAGEVSTRLSRFSTLAANKTHKSTRARASRLKLSWEDDRHERLRQFHAMIASTELYLADSLSCLGYCYDVKLCQYDKALSAYNDSLALYRRNAGGRHLVVSNGLHNLATIYVEMKRWKEALRCYVECIDIASQRKEGQLLEPREEDLADSLNGLGRVYTELKQFDMAEESYQKSIDTIDKLCSSHKAFTGDKYTLILTNSISCMGKMYLSQAACLAAKWHAHNESNLLAAVSGGECPVRSPVQNASAILSSRREAESKGEECLRKAIENRRRTFVFICRGTTIAEDSPTGIALTKALLRDSQSSSHAGLLLDLSCDLNYYGSLCFRRRSYEEAILCLKEALLILGERGSLSKNMSYGEEGELLVPTHLIVSTLLCLSTSYSRVAMHEESLDCLNKVLSLIESNSFKYLSAEDKTATFTSLIYPDMEKANILYRIGVIKANRENYSASSKFFMDAISLMQEVANRARAFHDVELTGAEETNPKLTKGRSYEKGSKESTRLAMMGINISLSCVYFSLGRVFNLEKNLKRALQCFESGMQYHLAVQSYKASLKSFSSLESSWFFFLSEPLSRTAWCGISSVQLMLLTEEVATSSGCIELTKKNNEFAAYSHFVRAFQIGKVSADCRAFLHSHDEEYDYFRSDCDANDVSLSCCSFLCQIIKRLSTKVSHRSGERQMHQRWTGWLGLETNDEGQDENEDALISLDQVLIRMAKLHALSGDYTDALECYEKVENLVNEEMNKIDPIVAVEIKRNQGLVYRDLYDNSKGGDKHDAWDKAVQTLEESLKLMRKMSDQDISLIADTSMTLAELYFSRLPLSLPGQGWLLREGTGQILQQGQARKLLHHLLKALDIRVELRGEVNLDVAATKHVLGVFHLTQEKNDDAVKYLREAYKMRSELLPRNDLSCADTIRYLGRAYLIRSKDDDLRQVLGALQEAIRIQKFCREKEIGPNRYSDLSWIIAETLSDVAYFHYLGDSFDESKIVYEEALVEYASVHSNGCDSETIFWRHGSSAKASIAHILSCLAEIHVQCGRLPEALACYKSALECLPEQSNDEPSQFLDLKAARIKLRLASVYYKQQSYQYSLPLYTWCSTFFREYHGKQTSCLLLSLTSAARIHLEKCDYTDAAECLTEALVAFDQFEDSNQAQIPENNHSKMLSLGLLHYDLARSLVQIDGREQEAEEEYCIAASLLEKMALQPFPSLPNKAIQVNQGENQGSLNRKVLECYHQIERLSLLQKHTDTGTDAEKSEKSLDVKHHVANLHAAYGEHQKAAVLYEEVISIQKGKTGEKSLLVADLLFNLGTVYLSVDEVDKAFACHKESQLISEELLGKQSSELVENMRCLGDIAARKGKWEDALLWYSSTEEGIRGGDVKQRHQRSFMQIVYKKGKCLEQLGRLDEGTDCFKRALQICQNVNEPDSLDASDIMNSLGNAYKKTGDFKRAMKLYQQSYALRRRHGNQLSIANTLNNIGATLYAQGESQSAIKLFAQALHTKTLELGPEDSETARSLANVGQAFLGTKDYDRAQRCFFDACRVLKKTLGNRNLEVAACLHSLGLVLENFSDPSKALAAYSEAIAIFDESSCEIPAHGVALHNVGMIHFRQGNFKLSARFLKSALQVKATCFGEKHEDTVDTCFSLAEVSNRLGMVDEASELYIEVLRSRVDSLGKKNIKTSDVLVSLGQIHRAKGEIEDALAALLEAHRVKKLLTGPKSDEIAELSMIIGDIMYYDIEDEKLALEFFTEAWKIKVEINGKDHIGAVSPLFSMGDCLFKMEAYTEALLRYEESLDIRFFALVDEDEEISHLLERIGTSYQKLDKHDEAIDSFKRALAIKENSGLAGDSEDDIGRLLHSMGNSYRALRRFKEAEEKYDTAFNKRLSVQGNLNELGLLLLDKAGVHMDVGEMKGAIAICREILKEGYFEPNSWELGQTLQRTGRAFIAEGLTADALQALQRAVETFEICIQLENCKIINEGMHQDLINTYEDLFNLPAMTNVHLKGKRGELCYKIADSYVQTGKHEKALQWFTVGLRRHAELLGEDHPTVAQGYFNKGNCSLFVGNVTEAIQCLEKSLQLYVDALDENNIFVADTYFSLAHATERNSDFRQASSLYERSYAIQSILPDADVSRMTTTLSNIGRCLASVGNHDKSISVCRDALALHATDEGSRSYCTSDIFDSLASAHKGKGQVEQSLHYLHKALSTREERDTDNAIKAAMEYHNLSLLWELRGETDRSKVAATQSLRICENYLGLAENENAGLKEQESSIDYYVVGRFLICREKGGVGPLSLADAVLFYGKLLQRDCRLEDALSCFDFALAMYQEMLDPDHLSIGECMHHKGMVSALRKDFVKSASFFSESLQIRKAKLPAKHEAIEETLQFLGATESELGHFEKAIKYFTQAMSIRSDRPRNRQKREEDADTFLRLGKLHQENKEYEKAQKAFESCLYHRKLMKGRRDRDIGEVFFALGVLFLEIGKREVGLIRFQDALRLYKNDEEQNKVEIADVLFSIGILYFEQDDFQMAIHAYCQSLRIRRGSKIAGASCAQVLTNIGCVYHEVKDYAKSQEYHVQALHLMEKSLGKTHEDVAFCWYSLGRVYLDDGQVHDAISAFSNSLSIQNDCLEESHIDIGNTRHMLGRCNMMLKGEERAILDFTEALRIRKLHLDTNDPDIEETLRLLGILLARKGDDEEALEHFQDVIRLSMARLGGAKTIDDIEYTSMVNCFDFAKTILCDKFGENSEQVGTILQQRGTFEAIMKNNALAIESYSKSLQILKKIYGERHITAAGILFNMGMCFNESNHPKNAIKCLAKARSLTCEKVGQDHVDVADIDYQMGSAYRLMEDYSTAVQHYEKSLLILKQSFGLESLKIASIMQDIGDVCLYWKDSTKAERCYRECLRIRTSIQGQDTLGVSSILRKLGVLHRTKREYSQALLHLEDSLVSLIEFSGDAVEKANTYHDLACVHQCLKNNQKALFCNNECLRLYKEMRKDENLVVAKATTNKAAILLQIGDDKRGAMLAFERALEIRNICLGEDSQTPSEELADILYGQAQWYDKMGEAGKAIDTYERCLSCYQNSIGHETEKVARVIQSIAAHFMRGSHYSQAHDAVIEALRLRESLGDIPDDDIADSMLTLGSILFTWGDLSNAHPYLEKAYAIHRKVHGKYHSSVGVSSFMLGCIHESLQDYDKGLSYLEDALHSKKEELGEDHREIGDVFAQIGNIHIAIDDPGAAVLCFEEALRICRLAHGLSSEEVAACLTDLSTALVFDSEIGKASDLVEDALRIYMAKGLDTDLGLAKCQGVKGMVLEKQNDTNAAREWYKNAITMFDELLPDVEQGSTDFQLRKDYLELADIIFKHASVEETLGDEEKAIDLYHRATTLYTHLLGTDHPNIARIKYQLGLAAGRQGKLEKAKELLQNAAEIRTESLGRDHPDVGAVLLALGITCGRMDDHGEAERCYAECLRIQRAGRGSNGAEVAATLEHLGMARGNRNDYYGAVEAWEEALRLMTNLGHGEASPLVQSLSEHLEVALLLLSGEGDEAQGVLRSSFVARKTKPRDERGAARAVKSETVSSDSHLKLRIKYMY